MSQSESRAASLRLQIYFYPGRPSRHRRHTLARLFPSPREHHTGIGKDFEILTADYIPPIWIEAIDSTGLRVDLRMDSHPTNHFCLVGKKLEDDGEVASIKITLIRGINGQRYSSLVFPLHFLNWRGRPPRTYREGP
jgi:hypothetical protein